MVEQVAELLQGRGHRVVRARAAGLAKAADPEIAAYARSMELILVTFDRACARAAVRQGGRALYVQMPEQKARATVSQHYGEVVDLLGSGAKLVTLPREGPPREDLP